MPIQIRALQKSDERSGFHSGQSDLDNFFQRFAGQNQFRHHIGVTYVATDEEQVFGYVTVATGSVERVALPEGRKLPPNYPLPVLRLGRLAVDQRYQGQGIGKLLLRHVFLLALQQKEQVGCVGVIVDAKPDAIPFYQRYGFQQLDRPLEGEIRGHPSPIPLFLAIQSIPGGR